MARRKAAAPDGAALSLLSAARGELARRYHETGAALKAIPGTGAGAYGLTPDSVKAGAAWQAASAAHQAAFAALRAFNARLGARGVKALAAYDKARRGDPGAR